MSKKVETAKMYTSELNIRKNFLILKQNHPQVKWAIKEFSCFLPEVFKQKLDYPGNVGERIVVHLELNYVPSKVSSYSVIL